MKNITLILSIIIALIVGAGIGYSLRKDSSDHDADAKKLQDSIVMMKEQAVDIKKMAEMMKTGGLMMQEIGMKSNNNEAIVQGKDLEVLGEKYLKDSANTSGSSDSMKKMMDN